MNEILDLVLERAASIDIPDKAHMDVKAAILSGDEVASKNESCHRERRKTYETERSKRNASHKVSTH
jgi:hypothetical protein